MSEKILLSIKDVSTAFKINGEYYTAIDKVSLDLHQDEVLAIVGESGSGKSTLATSIISSHIVGHGAHKKKRLRLQPLLPCALAIIRRPRSGRLRLCRRAGSQRLP